MIDGIPYAFSAPRWSVRVAARLDFKAFVRAGASFQLPGTRPFSSNSMVPSKERILKVTKVYDPRNGTMLDVAQLAYFTVSWPLSRIGKLDHCR